MTQIQPSPPPGSVRAYWACQVAGWGGYALVQFVVVTLIMPLIPELPGMPVAPWPIVAVEALGLNGMGIALSHALRAYIRRQRWEMLAWPQLSWRIVVAGLVASIPVGIPYHFSSLSVLQGYAPDVPEWAQTLQHVINWAPVFWIWMIIYFVVLSARRRRWAELQRSELARALQAAELRLLKAQLNPHFLFNSLNSVRALIADDPAAAQNAVTKLARTMRYTLGAGQQEFVTLDRELEMVNDYLELESLRLGERLRIERDIAPATLSVQIPVMLLQTLVENAIKHGIAELPGGGTLRISARLEDGALRIAVDNPRPTVAPKPTHESVGLRNATERLRLLFGPAADLDLDLTRAETASARVRIPAAA